MKKTIALALLAFASFLSTGFATAQSFYRRVQYLPPVPPVQVMTVCNVNGVDYPIDYGSQIWGHNLVAWFVIGEIINYPYAPIAVRSDGLQFPAVCN